MSLSATLASSKLQWTGHYKPVIFVPGYDRSRTVTLSNTKPSGSPPTIISELFEFWLYKKPVKPFSQSGYQLSTQSPDISLFPSLNGQQHSWGWAPPIPSHHQQFTQSLDDRFIDRWRPHIPELYIPAESSNCKPKPPLFPVIKPFSSREQRQFWGFTPSYDAILPSQLCSRSMGKLGLPVAVWKTCWLASTT